MTTRKDNVLPRLDEAEHVGLRDQLATLDRHIRIVSGPTAHSSASVSFAHPLSWSCWGEPGIGKSTVLKQEAKHEGARVITVRDLATGLEATGADTYSLTPWTSTGSTAHLSIRSSQQVWTNRIRGNS